MSRLADCIGDFLPSRNACRVFPFIFFLLVSRGYWSREEFGETSKRQVVALHMNAGVNGNGSAREMTLNEKEYHNTLLVLGS